LVFEYITGGGLINEALSRDLAAEGDRMLGALATDLLDLPDIELIIPRDPRLAAPEFQRGQSRLKVVEMNRNGAFEQRWRELLDTCDAVWPIAPETGHILTNLCQSVQDDGKILLNSPAVAVKRATSKLATAVLLEEKNIPVVPTWPLRQARSLSAGPWVLKPDDGVGCVNIRIIRELKELEQIDLDRLDGEWVIQPLIAGDAISLSLLCRRGEARLLSCNRQQVTMSDGSFRLSGCLVNGVRDISGIFRQLAGRIARALPQLWGYIGVDLIVSADGPLVLEINPRLTTSYAGLHQALGINPAGLVMKLLDQKEKLMPPKRHLPASAVAIEW
jgi:tyramine---L-glutamate ligase